MSATFQKSAVQNKLKAKGCSFKALMEYLSKRGKIGSNFKFKLRGLIKGNFGSTITWRKREEPLEMHGDEI